MSEETVVRQCAPTLAGIKTGSLFPCPYDSREELLQDVRSLNKRLVPKGLCLLPMRYQGNRALLYLYRPRCLRRDLTNDLATEVLSGAGYQGKSCEQCVARLMHRLREGQEFPHEVGLFLSYPPEDVKGFIDKGQLAPDALVIDLIADYVSKHKESKGNICDGFPRTTPQAEAFDKIMEQHGTPVNLMLALEVSDDELIDRLLKRGKESGRADDSCESVIRNRIDVYKAQTAIVADHYRRQGKFRAIRGTGSIEEIFRSICCQIDPLLEKPDAASVRVG